MMEDGIMSRYRELMEIFCSDGYRSRYLSARNANKCIRCGNVLEKDIDPAAKLDYRLSALCPDCFNLQETPKIKDDITVVAE